MSSEIERRSDYANPEGIQSHIQEVHIEERDLCWIKSGSTHKAVRAEVQCKSQLEFARLEEQSMITDQHMKKSNKCSG